MNTPIENLRNVLRSNSDDKTKESGQRFFREKVNICGIPTALVEKIGKDFFKMLDDKSKSNIFSICEELWKSGVLEESFIACNLSYYIHSEYESADFSVFEKWVDLYVSNWASCDTLCNHSVGSLVEMYPDNIAGLKRWAVSDNRWMKRASAVSLIIPAKKGMFLEDIFEIAQSLLTDKDDMVQKGYGWMLKAASQAHLQEVYEFVIRYRSIMPRTAYRYAIEKMPADLKAAAMKK